MEKMITEQEYIEATNKYRARNEKLACRNMLLSANIQNLETENGSLRFRYENMKKLLGRFIATGLMPGYFDIYNQLCETKVKLKEARKEAAAANKRYKQLNKEFARYRNMHTDSDCNPYIAKIRDLEQQIEAMHAGREWFTENVCDPISRQAVLALTKDLKFDNVKGLEHYRYRCIDPNDVLELPSVCVDETLKEESDG